MNIFTLNDDFGGHRSLFCEAADVVGEDGERFVRIEDHLASHAFDEEKERALFEQKFSVLPGILWDQYRKQYYGHQLYWLQQTQLDVWLACAKSRANQ